jgi:hypothetical protein
VDTPAEISALNRVDHIGTYLSFACAVHCALTPLAVALLPFLAFESASQEIIHKGVILVSVVLAVGGFCWGVRRHKAWHLLLLVGSGIALLTFSQFGSNAHAEMIVVGGVLCLAASHWINRQLCKRCLCCEQLEK